MIKKFNQNHLIIPGHLRNEKRIGKEPVKIPCNISAQESIKKCWSCLNYSTKGKQTNKQTKKPSDNRDFTGKQQ